VDEVAQLDLDLDSTPPSIPLADRLYALGLPAGTPVSLTRNRTVMMSWRARSGLRLHAGFAAAPDHVLQAIVRFLGRRVSRAERAAARRIFMAFPVDRHVASRPERSHAARSVAPEDVPIVERLVAAHAEFNGRHFDGELGPIPIRLSGRMRTRLGELRASRQGSPVEIAISRRHVRRHPWRAVLDTLLHEMVHQWQAQNGHALDHGRRFRTKATELGISPRAVADL